MTQPRRDRRWTEDLRVHDEAGNYLGVDRDSAIRAMVEVETILAREGGAITVMPIRQEQPPRPGALTGETEWVNVGYVFDHVFAPTAGRAPAPQQNGGPAFPQSDPDANQFDPALAEGDEPSAVMPQAVEPNDATEARPLDPAELVPRTS